jgi:uncharacterized protein (DUF736 family)
MATIGTFKKTGNEYTGAITTLSVQAKGVRIVPEENRSNDNAPSHRVFAPIYANLFDDESEDSFSLIWSRQPKRNGD